MHSIFSLSAIRVCPDCGFVCALPPPQAGFNMQCARCAKTFRRSRQHPITWTFACAITGFVFYSIVLTAPFLEVILYGRERLSSMMTGIESLFDQGLWILSVVILLTAVLMPLVKLVGLLAVFGGLHLHHPPRWLVPLFRRLKPMNTWSMVEIYLLGFLVAYTRLHAMASVHIEIAVFALMGLVLSMVSIDATLDPESVWDEMKQKGLIDNTKSAGPRLTGCRVCHQANAAEAHSCMRCGAVLHDRKPNSISRTWALIIAASIFYIPANLLPVMSITKLDRTQSYTIMHGVRDFVSAGLWPLALLVFVASIAIPLTKLFALIFMLWQTHRRSPALLLKRTRLYRLVEFVGRWSMIDIFMTSILVGLMRFGQLAKVTPGVGAVYFAAVVILTILAVSAFDPRLMWDAAERHEERKQE